MPRIVLLFILAVSMLNGSATAAEASLRLCYEDTSVYPWITGNNEGLVIFELHLVEKDLNQDFEFLRLPWKRCLYEVQEGRIHAAIAASYNKERTKWGSYPTNADGNLNSELRLHTDSFLVFRRSDSAIRWHDKKFDNLGNQSIGVQLGYSVGRELEELGYAIKYHPASEDLVRYLENNVLKVIVLQNHEANRLLEHKPGLDKIMIRETEVVKTADQYLLFNSNFYQSDKATVQAIWQSIAKARKSKAYLDEEARLLRNK